MTLFRTVARTLTAAVAALVIAPAMVVGQTPATGAAPEAAKGTIDLKPKFVAGGELKYVMEVSAKSANEVPQAPNLSGEQAVTKTIGFTMKVKEAGEGGATLELTYDTLKYVVKTPMMTLEFDSTDGKEKDEGNQLATALRPVVGLVLTVRVDGAGKITDVVSGDTAPQFKEVTGELTEASSVKSWLGPLLSTQKDPSTAAVGDTWKQEVADQGGEGEGGFVMKTTHTLDAVEDGRAKVSVTGTLEMLPVAEGVTPPFVLKDSKSTGKYTWDSKVGSVSSLEMALSFSGDGETQGVKFSVKNEQIVKFTRK